MDVIRDRLRAIWLLLQLAATAVAFVPLVIVAMAGVAAFGAVIVGVLFGMMYGTLVLVLTFWLVALPVAVCSAVVTGSLRWYHGWNRWAKARRPWRWLAFLEEDQPRRPAPPPSKFDRWLDNVGAQLRRPYDALEAFWTSRVELLNGS